MMYEIPVHTGILTGCNRNVENIVQNLTCLFKAETGTLFRFLQKYLIHKVCIEVKYAF